MNTLKLAVVSGVLAIVCFMASFLILAQDEATPLPSTLSGIVMNPEGPVADAIVQLHGLPDTTTTDADGMFRLEDVTASMPIIITAWSEGHFVGWTALDANEPDWQGGENIQITMRPLFTTDNNEYEWFSFEGVDGSGSCGLCHREYEEWQADQHSMAAINQRYLNLYTGEDVNGNVGDFVQFDSQGLPIPRDPEEPYYGPGFMLDNPGRVGNCATCHTPLASDSPNNQNCSWMGCHTSLTIERANGIIAEQPRMPQFLRGDAAEGISCDFCHKIGDVILDPETNLPKPDMPGILSYRLYRPPEGEQVFFGTLIDVPRRDTYLPLLSESEYCAGCHYGVFGGVVGNGEVKDGTLIYNSYGEWLASPYSDPETKVTCQDCHMPVSDANWFVYEERGGLVRDYVELHNHTMPGAADEELLQNAVSMTSSAEIIDDQLHVEVSIVNDQTGHHVPTDAPIRSMILVVEVTDENGTILELAQGPVNPDYSGNFGGLPGKTFAKVLRDEWSGETPTAAYWRPVTIVEDTRLAAMASDTTNYTFEVDSGTKFTINVQLFFRRAFYELAQQKGWDDPDILMEHETIEVSSD